MADLAAAAPRYFRAEVVMAGDVIEVDGQPWRVVAGKLAPATRRLALKHASYPNRTRVIRPRREAQLRMLAPHRWAA